MCRIAPVAALSRWMVAAAAPPAVAQPLGVFSWQLSPYCNVLTLAATLTGPAYRLKGFDDQCGAGRAAVIGMAVLNDDGTVGLGLTVVTAPGAAPVHIDATLNTSTLSGTWRDHAGNTGAFVFNPGAPAGPPRPAAPALAQLQRRVAGNCGTGTFMQAVNPDGSVSCAPDAAGNGDITSVTAGAGLTGGGGGGDVSLAVSYAGPGVAAAAARSDHTHALANASNTAVGSAALSALTTGADNTVLGEGRAGTSPAGCETSRSAKMRWLRSRARARPATPRSVFGP